MGVRAWVLIEAVAGKGETVRASLDDMECVKEVEQVTGLFDVIAQVEGSDMNAIGDIVTRQIHAMAEITRTITCAVVE
ncbi:Lrp/AsnC family transcriptional regulator [Patescibacteria group bacterium]|nr:Lrp/AsnC family transcriptional regulator [Patescibacteria group bacterium]